MLMKTLAERESIEAGLHPSAHDGESSASVATRVPPDVFLRAFSNTAPDPQEGTKALWRHVYWQTIGWRSASAEIVDVRFNFNFARTRTR